VAPSGRWVRTVAHVTNRQAGGHQLSIAVVWISCIRYSSNTIVWLWFTVTGVRWSPRTSTGVGFNRAPSVTRPSTTRRVWCSMCSRRSAADRSSTVTITDIHGARMSSCTAAVQVCPGLVRMWTILHCCVRASRTLDTRFVYLAFLLYWCPPSTRPVSYALTSNNCSRQMARTYTEYWRSHNLRQIQRVVLTVLNSFSRQFFFVSTNVTSALEVFLKWYALYKFTFYFALLLYQWNRGVSTDCTTAMVWACHSHGWHASRSSCSMAPGVGVDNINDTRTVWRIHRSSVISHLLGWKR